MSSKFNDQSAGVFWPPKVCKSKLLEQLQNPAYGNTAVAIVSGRGVHFTGPWEINQTIRLKRNLPHEDFQSGLVHSHDNYFYQVLIQPSPAGNPYQIHLAFFFGSGPSPAMWSGDSTLGDWHPPTDLKTTITNWPIQFGSGVADARVWLH
jgi:hypothetical protein